MDLEPGWEKKALIVLGIIFVIIAVYAFNPFHSNSDVKYENGTADNGAVTPAPVATTGNSTANNTTVNTTNNSTFQISADVAKNIASGAYPGYTAGQPTQGNVTINNTLYSVWIVPVTQASITKKVYVDLSTGTVVGSI